MTVPIVISRYVKNNRKMALFECLDCGSNVEARAETVGKTTGRCVKCANINAGLKRRTHGHNNKNSRLHVTWANMKRRCLRPVGIEKRLYEGISICEEWLDFESFMKWSLENGYNDTLTIDRIDPTKGYEPSNCRYVNRNVQAANRKITSKNKSGRIGVSFHKGKWRATVMWKRKQINLGRHDTIEQAAMARNRYLDEHNMPHTRS